MDDDQNRYVSVIWALDNRKLWDLLREYSIELEDDVANANITELLCALGYYAGFRDLDARLLALACGTLFFSSSLKHSVTLLPQGPVREKEKRIEKNKKGKNAIWFGDCAIKSWLSVRSFQVEWP